MPRNIVDITVHSNVKGSSRRLKATQRITVGDSVLWSIVGLNSAGEPTDGIIHLDKKASIDVALNVLRALAPKLLLDPPKQTFSQTPVGTFLKNRTTGRVAQVVEWDDRFKGYRRDDDTVAAEDSQGRILVPYQDELDPKYGWDVVQAKVTVKKVFEIVESETTE